MSWGVAWALDLSRLSVGVCCVVEAVEVVEDSSQG